MDAHDLALAYTLSSVAGLRATLTVLALTIAVHLHALTGPPNLGWLASDTTLWIVALAGSFLAPLATALAILALTLVALGAVPRVAHAAARKRTT